jgi:hypothetical protein
MQSSRSDPGAPPLSRAELELELARLASRLGRTASRVGFTLANADAAERRAALAGWYAGVATSVVRRAAPELRDYAEARVRRIATACSALSNPDAGRAGVHRAPAHPALRRHRREAQPLRG